MAKDFNPPHVDLSEAIAPLQTFGGSDLTRTLGQIENSDFV